MWRLRTGLGAIAPDGGLRECVLSVETWLPGQKPPGNVGKQVRFSAVRPERGY